MSIQSEIERINNNVQSSLSICSENGVEVASDANSDALPAAVSALAAQSSGGGGSSNITFAEEEPTEADGVDGELRLVHKMETVVTSRLPSGYAELQYIESTGTQYIDTGFQPDQDTRTVIDIEATKTSSKNFVPFGCRVASNNGDYSLWYDYSDATKMYTNYGNNSATLTVANNLARLTIDKNKNVTSVNGAVAQNTANSFTKKLNLFLLSLNANGSEDTSRRTSAKLYACQIYDNGTLVRDFVPCRNPDGEVGLYDVVNGVFYGNAGSGVFYGVLASLPIEFTEVEYIESSGTQWINTNHCVGSQNIRLQVDMAYTNTNADGVSFGGGAEAAYAISMYGKNPSFWIGKSGSLCALSVTQGVRTSLDIHANNGTLSVTQDGTTKTASYSGTMSSANPISIFAQSVGSGAIQYASIRVYAFKIYDNGVLVRDFVPCKNASGVAGLFDMVDGNFHSNSGTGTFMYGVDVESENPVITVEVPVGSGFFKVDGVWYPMNATAMTVDQIRSICR